MLVGAGAGVVIGVYAGGRALAPAAVAVGVGLLLLVARSRSGGRDLVGDVTTAGSAAPGRKNDTPALSGLGTRVHEVLRLAEDQAADHIAEAKRTAERIVADARAEAERQRGQ